MSISVWTNKNPLDAEWVGPNQSDKYEQIKDIKHLNPVEIEAMVLNHEQQIKDIATHLLELKQSMFKPGGMSLTTEFNPVIPVAWLWDEAKFSETDVRGRCWSPMIGRMHPMNPQMTRNIVPLYTKLKEKNGG